MLSMFRIRFLALFLLFINSVCKANELPVIIDWILDSSQINQAHHSTTATRSLIAINYSQSFLVGNGTLTPQISYNHFQGKNGSDIAQDIQGFSNIDANQFGTFQEVALQYDQQNWFVRAGQLDANADFLALEHASWFLNASFGLSPTAFAMPTYPEPQLGALLQFQTSETSAVKIGIYQTSHEIAQASGAELWLANYCLYCVDRLKAQVGYWQVSDLQISAKIINGYYGFIEGFLRNNWQGFALYSHNNANQAVAIEQHIKAGVTYQPKYAVNHSVGIAFSRLLGEVDETALELFYLFPANKYLTIQPDIQWLSDSNSEHPDSTIFTLRLWWSY